MTSIVNKQNNHVQNQGQVHEKKSCPLSALFQKCLAWFSSWLPKKNIAPIIEVITTPQATVIAPEIQKTQKVVKECKVLSGNRDLIVLSNDNYDSEGFEAMVRERNQMDNRRARFVTGALRTGFDSYALAYMKHDL